jgi:hypothetical protein
VRALAPTLFLKKHLTLSFIIHSIGYDNNF